MKTRKTRHVIRNIASSNSTFYHGCSARLKEKILKTGLRKGSYVSAQRFIARGYAGAMFTDEPRAMIKVILPNDLIDSYLGLDNEDDDAVEVIKTIPPQFLR
jgi:hypothetical protein